MYGGPLFVFRSKTQGDKTYADDSLTFMSINKDIQIRKTMRGILCGIQGLVRKVDLLPDLAECDVVHDTVRPLQPLKLDRGHLEKYAFLELYLYSANLQASYL